MHVFFLMPFSCRANTYMRIDLYLSLDPGFYVAIGGEQPPKAGLPVVMRMTRTMDAAISVASRDLRSKGPFARCIHQRSFQARWCGGG